MNSLRFTDAIGNGAGPAGRPLFRRCGTGSVKLMSAPLVPRVWRWPLSLRSRVNRSGPGQWVRAARWARQGGVVELRVGRLTTRATGLGAAVQAYRISAEEAPDQDQRAAATAPAERSIARLRRQLSLLSSV